MLMSLSTESEPTSWGFSCLLLPISRVMLSGRESRDGGRRLLQRASSTGYLLQSLNQVPQTDLHPVFEIPIFLTNGCKGLSVSALLLLFIASVFVWQKVFVFNTSPAAHCQEI